MSPQLLNMSSFCQNMACGCRERAVVYLGDIYVWRMESVKYGVTRIFINLTLIDYRIYINHVNSYNKENNILKHYLERMFI